MEWLQKIYIAILNPFCGLSERIDEKSRRRLTYAVAFLLYATCYVWYSIIGMGTELTLLSRMLESIVLIITLIFLGLEKPLRPVKWDTMVMLIWFALGMLMFILGFFTEQNTGYWMTGPVIALGLPCLYMVYGKREKYEMLFDAVCKAAIICSIVYFFVCIAGEFFNDNTWDVSGRYNGLTIDANKIGELCLTSFCCIMYYLLTVKNNRAWKIAAVIALAMILGQTYLTQSRTTIVGMIFIAGFYLIIVLKDSVSGKNLKLFAEKLIPVVLSIVLATVCVSVINKVYESHLMDMSAFLEQSAGSDTATESVAANETTVTQETETTTAASEETVQTHEYRDMLPEEGADLNSFSSGRLFIWQTYAEGFNLIGNDADAATPISPAIKQRTAHNSIVEITYRSGYITGGVYVILVLITGIYILRVMFRSNRKNSNGDYFMAITAIGYIIFTSLMSSFNPLTASIFLLYAIAFPVLLDRWRIKKSQ